METWISIRENFMHLLKIPGDLAGIFFAAVSKHAEVLAADFDPGFVGSEGQDGVTHG